MVQAHADDEIIFGYPIFQDISIKKTLLCCSSDLFNPERQWCSQRKYALEKCCDITNTELICLDNPSSFYSLPSRRPKGAPSTPEGDSQAPLRKACDQISESINELQENVDFIYTHNPYGEYGHRDHQTCFDLVLKSANKGVLITDIHLPSNWSQHYSFNEKMKNLYYKNVFKENIELDVSLYNSCKTFYEEKNSWTWNRQTIEKCNLYLI